MLLGLNEAIALIFEHNPGVDLTLIIPLKARAEDLVLHELEMLCEVEIPVGEEVSVGWVVVLLVEVDELLILQVSDKLRLPARVKMILRLGEEVLVEALHEGAARIAHCSLHLVVDDALAHEGGVGVLGVDELESVALLPEVVVVQVRRERHVRVHRQQVAEVLRVLGRERVHREVSAGQCVHKGVQTALKHVKERVAHGVMLGPARGQMLKDMRLAGVIIRGRPKHHREDVVCVTRVEMEPLGTSSLVSQLVGFEVELSNLIN